MDLRRKFENILNDDTSKYTTISSPPMHQQVQKPNPIPQKTTSISGFVQCLVVCLMVGLIAYLFVRVKTLEGENMAKYNEYEINEALETDTKEVTFEKKDPLFQEFEMQ